MFESIVLGFFGFAVGYVVLMRVMARRADVLYGAFIAAPSARPARGITAGVARLSDGARRLLRR